MKFIELFCGIGGFRLGLENTGHECVWANEWLEKPASIYRRNFKHEPDRRDIRDVPGGSLPKADLIVGGFPCATFSVAGKRTGFSLEDARGTLCFEMFRIASEGGIPYLLFENVKGMLNNDSGKTFAVVINSLDELGYDAQWEVLDSQNFGVPQHRERLFLIANLRGKPRPKVFPIGRTVGENEKKNKSTSRKYIIKQWRRGYFRDYKSEGSPTLTANMGTGGHNVPFLTEMTMLSHTTSNMKQRTQMRSSFWTMDTNPQNKMVLKDKGGIRKLTPLECERLQGLPDNFTKYYHDGSLVSDSERYERCGRTVSIPVIEEIGKKLGYDFY